MKKPPLSYECWQFLAIITSKDYQSVQTEVCQFFGISILALIVSHINL